MMDYYNIGLGLGNAPMQGQMDRAKLNDLAGLAKERESTARFRGAQIEEYMRQSASDSRAKAILAETGVTDVAPTAQLPKPAQTAAPSEPTFDPQQGAVILPNAPQQAGLAQTASPQQGQSLTPEHLLDPKTVEMNPGDMYLKAGKEMMKDPLVDNETALKFIKQGHEMTEKVAEVKAKNYWPLLIEMYKKNDQAGIDALTEGLKKDKATWEYMGKPTVKSGGAGGIGSMERDMTAEEAYAAAKKVLPPDMVGSADNWPAGRYSIKNDGTHKEMKQVDKKAPTVHSFTEGDSHVDKEWDAKTGTWKEVSRGSRYKPTAPGGAAGPTPLTPESAKMEGAKYLLTGKLPFTGMGGKGRAEMINEATNIAKEHDWTPNMVLRMQADYKGMDKSVANQRKNYDAMNGFVINMDKQMTRLDEAYQKLPRAQYKLLNVPLVKLRTVAQGSGEEASTAAILIELGNESGKLSTNSASSIRELSESAQKQWAKIHDNTLSYNELKKVLETTKKLGHDRVASTKEAMDFTLNGIEALGGGKNPEAPGSKPPRTEVERRKTASGKVLVKYSDGTIEEAK